MPWPHWRDEAASSCPPEGFAQCYGVGAPQKASPSATGRGALTPACRPPQIWWLDPELTYGSAKPFVFTQGHSVCNRSFFPCFDTPAVKCTYSAIVKVSAHRPGRPSHDPLGPPPGRRPRSSPRGRHCPAGGPAPVWVLGLGPREGGAQRSSQSRARPESSRLGLAWEAPDGGTVSLSWKRGSLTASMGAPIKDRE